MILKFFNIVTPQKNLTDFNYPLFKKQQIIACNQSIIKKHKKDAIIYIEMSIKNMINERADTIFLLSNSQA